MTESIFAGCDFDEDTKVFDRGNGSAVDPTDLDVFGQCLDPCQGGLGCDAITGSHRDGAVFLDVDLCRGLFLDRPDGLAAGSDQQADLLGIDLGPFEAWCMLGDVGSRLTESAQHRSEDVQTRVLGLGQGSRDDLLGNALDLQVQLDPGDTDLATGDLEVHVTEVILVADNVGQQLECSVGFGDNTDRNAGNWLEDWHAGGHQAQGRAANAGHRTGSVRLGDVRDGPDRVGERLGVGKD